MAPDTPRLNSQDKVNLFAPGGQRAGEKRQRQEIEDEGDGKRNRGGGKGYFPQRDKGRPLDERRHTDKAHRQMQFKKKKRNPHVRMKCLILIGKLIRVVKSGLLIPGLPNFDKLW